MMSNVSLNFQTGGTVNDIAYRSARGLPGQAGIQGDIGQAVEEGYLARQQADWLVEGLSVEQAVTDGYLARQQADWPISGVGSGLTTRR
jgi:hypothetical protein